MVCVAIVVLILFSFGVRDSCKNLEHPRKLFQVLQPGHKSRANLIRGSAFQPYPGSCVVSLPPYASHPVYVCECSHTLRTIVGINGSVNWTFGQDRAIIWVGSVNLDPAWRTAS